MRSVEESETRARAGLEKAADARVASSNKKVGSERLSFWGNKAHEVTPRKSLEEAMFVTMLEEETTEEEEHGQRVYKKQWGRIE